MHFAEFLKAQIGAGGDETVVKTARTTGIMSEYEGVEENWKF